MLSFDLPIIIQTRNCQGAPTGGAPLFDRTMTLKITHVFFTQRPAKASAFPV